MKPVSKLRAVNQPIRKKTIRPWSLAASRSIT